MQNRQTYSYLADQFARAGLKPLTRFGQNFLIDLNLVELIANSAEIISQDIVLEVGTGTGSLTSMIAQKAGWVVTVEVDEGLFKLAAKELKDRPNVTQLLQDALKNKNRLAPSVLEAIDEARTKVPDGRLKLVANLPYNVATPIISNLLLLPSPPVMIVATIQKELADRIAAPHNSRDYSALTIWIQSQCQVEIVRTLPPTVFWPQPKVTSAVLRLTRDPSLGARITDLKFFHETVRALFFHRRKYLRSNVISAMTDKLDKSQVDRVLDLHQFVATDRAEQLPVARIIDLVEALKSEIQQTAS